MGPTFTESNFRTRVEYEASLRLSEAEREEAEKAAAKAVEDKWLETQFVGQLVSLSGLKGRADLNGKRGRAVKYDPGTGRVGVRIKSVTNLGAVEYNIIALKPDNLTVIVAAPVEPSEADEAFTPDPTDASLRAVTWDNLLKSCDLRHLRKIHWSKFEEEILSALMAFEPRKPDTAAADKCLEEKAGVSSPLDRKTLIEALLQPAHEHLFAKAPHEVQPVEEFTEEGKEQKERMLRAETAMMGPEIAGVREMREEEGLEELPTDDAPSDGTQHSDGDGSAKGGESDGEVHGKVPAPAPAPPKPKPKPKPWVMTTVLKMFSARMQRDEKKTDKKFEKQRKEREEKTKGVPTADSRYTLQNGRVCEQRKGKIDSSDNCSPPPDGNMRGGDKKQPIICMLPVWLPDDST